MSILTSTNLSQSFGGLDVFKGLSVSISNDARIGLVGPNGIGKTTLLLILAGLAQPSSGHVHFARGKRLGYLAQEAMQAFTGDENTVYEEMLTVFAELRTQESQLAEMAERMGGLQVAETALGEYLAAQTRFEEAGGYEYEARIQQVLEGLGFPETQWQTPLRQLSGGQMTRALLARLLLEKPDLLILDEPTNHLDVEAVEWLETTLRQWEGALLVVSHDRYFLDKVVNTVWEMTRTHLEVYRGNYSAYVKQREERWERQQREFGAEKERLERELDFIRRNIAGQRTDMAKGKLKRISRELVAIEQLGLAAFQNKGWLELGVGNVHPMTVDEAAEHVRGLRGPEGRPPRLHLRLQAQHRSGDIVLRTRGLKVGYPTRTLFTADDLELFRGNCAALIGPNGTGKTTFLRTILDQLPPLSGTVRLGASLKIGYFAQAHDDLNADRTVLEELLAHKNLPLPEARKYLAQYLFRGDDILKPVSALSGGERSRLALALLALQGANLLVLDEPTNHLDIPAQEVLEEVLEDFEGTILLVSHDRYLVDRLASQIWDLHDGQLRAYRGTYREFLAERERAAEQAKEAAATEKAQARAARAALRSAKGAPDRAASKEAKRRAETIHALEERIAELEARLDAAAQGLQEASEAQVLDRIQSYSREYADAQEELDRRLVEWERLAGEG